MSESTRRKEIWAKEFPFLLRLYNWDVISRVTVSRMSKKLLESHFGFDLLQTFKPCILDQHGNILTRVAETLYFKRFSLFNPATWYCIGSEDVYSAIMRLGEAKSLIRYVTVRHCGDIYVYKIPKDYTLDEWFQKIKSEDVEAVRLELAEVDNVS
jgi:hypothetical protein